MMSTSAVRPDRLARKSFAIASLIMLAATGVSHAEPFGVDALAQFHRLPEARLHARAYQYSSRDPGGRNYDWTGNLGTQGSEKILLDVKGPGCVYRIWVTTSNNHRSDGIWRIYLDNSTTPAVQTTLANFFSGAHPGFPSPLVGNHFVSSGGMYCYVPIPFRERCRITSTNAADLNYHNITYHRFASADDITTWTPQQPLQPAIDTWNAAGNDPKPDTGSHTETRQVSLAGKETADLLDVAGAGTIAAVELNIPSPATWMLSGLKLEMTWDGDDKPAVDAPLGLFFANGLSTATTRALPVGIIGSRFYCYFPMPYRSHATIRLVNTTPTPVTLSSTVRYTPAESLPGDLCTFRTQYQHTAHPVINVDHPLLHETGAGHMVGVVQVLRGYTNSQWYLEGDERIYVDGMQTPALYGTGTEDFYNGGWYFENGEFSLPTHGMPEYMSFSQSAYKIGNSCYRFFLSDPIPFTQSIRAGIEHGGWNEFDVDIESLAFYYKAPHQRSVVSSVLNIRNTASEQEYNYVTNGSNVQASLSYEGEDTTVISDLGRRLGVGGQSSFTAYLHTANNRGAVLRKRFDYTGANQEVGVIIDGVYAGRWYDPGSNARFADSEFFVPPSLTQGKTQLQVTLQVPAGTPFATEYRYTVLTLLPDAPDVDTDGDGWPDAIDNCPDRANPDQSDTNHNGLGDLCDMASDTDGDGVPDPIDNCRLVPNPDQANSDGDVYGDVCDACPNTVPGIPVTEQGCPYPVLGDFDGDGDVDQSDFALMQRCMSGANIPQTTPGCSPAWLEGNDYDVDAEDLRVFLRCMGGAYAPPADPSCVGTPQ